MQRTHFPPHGVYSLAIEGRILVMHAQGPWNEELTSQYGVDVHQFTEALAGLPWALLGVVKREGVHTPESYRLQREILEAHRMKGRVATAIVFDYDDAPQIAKRVFDKLYTEAGEPHAFFDDEVSARIWLIERLRLAGEGR